MNANPDATIALSDLLLRSTALLLLAGLVALALRRASAAARHLHWQLALAGLLALPLLAPALPALHVPVPAALVRAVPWLTSAAAAAAPRPAPRAPAGDTLAGVAAEGRDPPSATECASVATTLPPGRGLSVMATAGVVSVTAGSSQPAGPPALPRARPASPPPAGPAGGWRKAGSWLLFAWIAGAALVIATLVVGLLRAGSLARACRPLTDAGWLSLAEGVRRELGLRRRVRLLLADGPVVPMTWGLRAPVVLLPADALDWSPVRRRHVLLHELAHVRRGDWITQILAQLTCALYWFQPLAWLAARALRRERERACDDLVLLAGGRASEYAGHLLDIARSRTAALPGGAAALAMARRSQLEGRLLAVLDAHRDRRHPPRLRAVLAALLAAAVVVPLACMRPQADAPVPVDSPAHDAMLAADPVDDVEAAAVVDQEAGPDGEDDLEAPDSFVSFGEGDFGSIDVDWDVEPADAFVLGARDFRLNLDRDIDGLHIRLGSFGGGDDDDRSTWTWTGPDGQITVESHGWFSVGEDDRSVTEIDDGGSLVVESRAARGLTRIEVLHGQDGEPRLIGSIADKDAGEAELRAALAELLPPILRHTGLCAEERIERLVDREGVPGVLAELGLLTGDCARLEYCRLLPQSHDLTTAETVELLTLAARDIEADWALRELLVDDPSRWLSDAALLPPLVAAVDGLDSDPYAAEVVESMFDAEQLQPAAAAGLLGAAARGIESDPYLAEVLGRLGSVNLREPAVAAAWFQAAATVESDAYLSEVLGELPGSADSTGALAASALQRGAAGIESDAYMADLLEAVDTDALGAAAVRSAFLAATAAVASDAYLADVVSARLADDADPALVVALLGAAAKGIQSDAYMADVLEDVPSGLLHDPSVRAAYEQAAGSIESRSYREDVMDRLPAAGERL